MTVIAVRLRIPEDVEMKHPLVRLFLFLSAVFVSAALLSAPAYAQCPVPAPAPPAPVCEEGGLVFGGAAAFTWALPAPLCGPVVNDALAGNLAVAWATKSVGASFIGCLAGEDDAAGPPAAADIAVPPIGGGFWYLARASTPGPDFTWNEAAPGQAIDRDALLAGVCP